MADTLDKLVMDKKQIKSAEYLYGVPDFKILKSMDYTDAINFKIRKAKELLHKLVEAQENVENFEQYSMMEQRMLAVSNAIEFNKKLLKETL